MYFFHVDNLLITFFRLILKCYFKVKSMLAQYYVLSSTI